MKYGLKEVIEKSKRANDLENKRLHPFGSKFSIYFSWLFINIGLTPNQVTGLFFLVGLVGAITLLANSTTAIIVSYILFRLHIIIDISDGEVARFTKKFSINGSYWDSMIHALLYPTFFLCMCCAQYLEYRDERFLLIGALAGIITSLMLSVKNNYFRAMLFNKVPISDFKTKTGDLPKTGMRFRLFSLISECMSFEGLFAGYIIISFIRQKELFLILFSIYILSFCLITLVKFYMLSKKGYYTTRS